jgi:hypothetical protein
MSRFIVVLTLVTAIILIAVSLISWSAHADGPPPPPPQGFRPGLYPEAVPRPQGSPGCLQTAQQLGYLTGRRELAYSATEACMYFTGARGVVMPYGFYGPYVPSGWTPYGWALPPPPLPY